MPHPIQMTEPVTEAFAEASTESGIGALKWEFLNIVFLSNAINAALGHNVTYAATKTKKERDKNGETLRRELSSAMVEFAEKYKAPVEPADHRKNLTALEGQVTKNCGSFLVGGKVGKEGHLRRGTAQKAFNLYLKFLWCMAGYQPRQIARLTAMSSGSCRRSFRTSSGRRLTLTVSTAQ